MIKVSKILKANCIRRAWIDPNGKIIEFDAEMTHEEYAYKIVEELGEDEISISPNSYLERSGWNHLGLWTESGGEFVFQCESNIQLHATQTFLMSHPDWKAAKVWSEYGPVEWDEFMTANKITDLKRLCLA